ncbi:MAG: prepilin-type N-terminal cleavage/methylation domain-containing protein [Deltaproteobacteria bacterium]|nr:prepilin-type N-terminal cleavage/methylation domain-containing protein [Deltaproteobacteria bacterium]
MRSRRKQRREGGFTMMELLITMLLLAIVMVGLASLQVHTVRQVTSSRRSTEAMRLGQSVLEQYNAMGYAQLPSAAADWSLETNAQGNNMQNVAVDGLSAGPYTVQRLVEDVGTQKLITIRVAWKDIAPGAAVSTGAVEYPTLQVTMTTQRSQ